MSETILTAEAARKKALENKQNSVGNILYVIEKIAELGQFFFNWDKMLSLQQRKDLEELGFVISRFTRMGKGLSHYQLVIIMNKFFIKHLEQGFVSGDSKDVEISRLDLTVKGVFVSEGFRA